MAGLGLDLEHVTGAVRDERLEVSGREQPQLSTEGGDPRTINRTVTASLPRERRVAGLRDVRAGDFQAGGKRKAGIGVPRAALYRDGTPAASNQDELSGATPDRAQSPPPDAVTAEYSSS